ncbi:uncharacterized protein LOC132787607 [Drosophila nasuta]|uniref:uncharacterized protein LOC132787607 n=1 Tax=Drosophila nasuta TaxID=42062 RepID=UPI00295E872A|nr:uncharacterized protein LOC132787607 [Drosophila nasuta]
MKSAMRKRNSRFNSDTQQLSNGEDGGNDLSLLQRPLRTAHTGFEEARRAYENGTSEVRRLLSEECSLIYECHVCRNMFRSLANFISHKRVFCCISARITSHNAGYTDQNSTMIIQPTSSQDMEHMLRSRSTGCSPVPREIRPMRGSMRDLSGVIERLRREKAPPAASVADAPVLQLEAMTNSNQAVYQTIKLERDDDSIKTEVNEVHHMLDPEQRTVVGPDGKAVTSSDTVETPEQSISDEAETNVFCEICNLTFQTHKTLELHIQKHHSSSAFVFQCPACSLTFLQAAAVIRHLSKDHKKPTRRIRMMRNTILKRRMQQGDVQAKGPNRELKRLQLSDDVVGQPVEQRDANGEQRKIMSLCIYCEKSFERRAALSTHLLNCRAKQEALAKPAPAVKKLKVNSNTASNLDSVEEERQSTAASPVDMQSIIDPKELNEMFADLAEQNGSYVPTLQTVSLDKLQLPHESDSSSDEGEGEGEDNDNSEEEHEEQPSIETEVDESESKPKMKKKRNVPIEKQLRCRCKICHKQFNALGNLRRHISMFHYRARRFGCTICDYRAFRRYDIVNHLGFTHKIEGDRDKLTEQYVATHECEYSRDDVDGDIVLLDKEQSLDAAGVEPTAEPKPAPKTYEKRSKRLKTNTELSVETAPSSPVAVAASVAVKEEPEEEPLSKKRRKSRTQVSPDFGERSFEKRPIRKRVKAVNKDFVYDLVSFKADPSGTPASAAAAAVDSMRAKLRRPTGNAVAAAAVEETKPKQWEAYITEEKKPFVQGITRRIMLELVSQGRAVSSTLPELPAERPQIRPRLISHTRSDCGQQQQQPQFVTDVANNSGESFIEKIAKRTISSLWNKVNNSIAQQQKPEMATESGDVVEAAPKAEAETEALLEMERQTQAEKKTETDDLHKTPNGKQSCSQQTPPSPPRKQSNVAALNSLSTSAIVDAVTSPPPPDSAPLPVVECSSSNNSNSGLPTMALAGATGVGTAATGTGTAGLFPTLPKPPSVLQAAANGTIQLTLDSLLRAALQN